MKNREIEATYPALTLLGVSSAAITLAVLMPRVIPGGAPYSLPPYKSSVIVEYGLSTVAAWLAWRFYEVLMQVNRIASRILWLAGGATLIALLLAEGARQFPAYDGSIMSDLAWRLLNDQRPYHDFVCTFPPGFYLGAKYAFLLFGVTWKSFVWEAGAALAVWYCWLSWILTRIFGERPVVILIALALNSVTLVACGHWWYNPVTALCSITTILAFLALVRYPERWSHRTSYTISLAFLLLMKPNIAGPAFFGIALLSVLFERKTAVRVFVLSLSSIAIAAFLLIAQQINPLEILASYQSVAGRGIRLGIGFWDLTVFERLEATWQALAIIVVVLVAADAHLRQKARRSSSIAAAFLLVGIGCLALLTNMELKIVDMSYGVAAVALLAFFGNGLDRAEKDPNPHQTISGSRAAVALCAAFLVFGCCAGWYRSRVKLCGLFFDWSTPVVIHEPRFFQGLASGREFGKVLDETREVIAAHPGESIYMSTRLAFAYPAFGLPSPQGMPLWWQRGAGFGMNQEDELLRRWSAAAFDLLIYVKKDFPDLAPQFWDLLHRDYVRDDSCPHLTLFHRRNHIPAAESLPEG